MSKTKKYTYKIDDMLGFNLAPHIEVKVVVFNEIDLYFPFYTFSRVGRNEVDIFRWGALSFLKVLPKKNPYLLVWQQNMTGLMSKKIIDDVFDEIRKELNNRYGEKDTKVLGCAIGIYDTTWQANAMQTIGQRLSKSHIMYHPVYSFEEAIETIIGCVGRWDFNEGKYIL